MEQRGLLLMVIPHKEKDKVVVGMLMVALAVVRDVLTHLTLQAVGLAAVAGLVHMCTQEAQ
jgi:hypothetical protein